MPGHRPEGWQRLFLVPLSRIYGTVTAVRNWLYDCAILTSQPSPVPTIAVGNLAVGGTGKTPHAEYIIDLLRQTYHVGVLSRGYKRVTKGFVIAGPTSTPRDIGDEPFQCHRKFGDTVTVAVCEDRRRGIREMLRIDPAINLIVLDDAFQHRAVSPDVAVCLTEFSTPVYDDALLPYGRLRESARGLDRADIIIVSKCPDGLTPLDFRLFRKRLNPKPFQSLYFTKLVYGPLLPLFPDQAQAAPDLAGLTHQDVILSLSGIADPRPFIRHLKENQARVKVNLYPDHHNYGRRDMEAVRRRYESLRGDRRLVITTEKDAVRLIHNPYFPPEMKPHAYYLPIRVAFDQGDGPAFETDLRKRVIDARQNLP